MPNSSLNNSLPFKYLEKDSSPEKIVLDGEEKNNIFESEQGKYDYVISILLKDDLNKSSEMLENTLKSIYANRDSLSDLGISTSTMLICVFINEIKGNSLFNKNDFVQIKKEKGSLNTYLYLKTHKEGYNSTSCIYLFSKAGYLSSVEALRFYYLNIISQLKRENKILFSSVITAGVMPNNTALKKLILNSYFAENKGMKGIAVGLVLSDGELNSYFAENKGMKGIAVGLVLSDGDGLFSMVEQYERLHFNIYDMNYLGSSSAFPVSSLLSTFALDDSILRCLKLYYTEANINQTIND